ncbi:RanBP1 domain-containing protein [Mycena olivaceomarginata]|nr:RanBP1 domain-containing protein [Mycena olivaceomarginata]
MNEATSIPRVHFSEEGLANDEPVVRLTEQIDTTAREDGDDVLLFKMPARLFQFDGDAAEWKERGMGDVRLIAHKESQVQLIMKCGKTPEVCVNHIISSDMRLHPIIGSDRSWAWKVAENFSESSTAAILSVRFANSGGAAEFRTAFEQAQKKNEALWVSASANASFPVDQVEFKTAVYEQQSLATAAVSVSGKTDVLNTEAGKGNVPSADADARANVVG